MKNAKRGKPQQEFSPNTLFSKKLCTIVPMENYSDAAAFFGVKRDAAKKYLAGITTPNMEAIQTLRGKYAKEHGGLLLDVNWLLDDSNMQIDPVFSEIAIDRMRNRICGFHAYFVGIFENKVLYYKLVTRGERRNLVPLVLGGDPENTIAVQLNQNYLPAIKGMDIVPILHEGDYIPDDALEVASRGVPEIAADLVGWAAQLYSSGFITEAGKNGWKYIKGKYPKWLQKTPPPTEASEGQEESKGIIEKVFQIQEALSAFGRYLVEGQSAKAFPELRGLRDTVQSLQEQLAALQQPPETHDRTA